MSQGDRDEVYRVLHNFRQFTLTNGDELVCYVVQFNDENDDNIIIKDAMKLNMYENQTGDKYFSFRPWMIYQEGAEELLILNSMHVIGIAIPPKHLLIEYTKAAKEMHHTHVNRIKGLVSDIPIEEVYKITREQLNKMAEQTDQLEGFLNDLERDHSSEDDYFASVGDLPPDSDGGGNVIDIFTGKKTIH